MDTWLLPVQIAEAGGDSAGCLWVAGIGQVSENWSRLGPQGSASLTYFIDREVEVSSRNKTKPLVLSFSFLSGPCAGGLGRPFLESSVPCGACMGQRQRQGPTGRGDK